ARLRYQPGTSYPFAPPFGFSFAIWGGDDALSAWIDRARIPLRPREITRLKRLAQKARTRGYLVHRLGGAEREALYAVLAARPVSSGRSASALPALIDEVLQADWVDTYLLDDAGPDELIDVTGFSAPIF